MIIHLLPEISCAKNAPATKKKRRKKTVAGQAGQGNVKISSEVVLGIRRMAEIERKTLRQIEKEFPMLSNKYIVSVIEYTIRANLKVRP